MMLNSTDDEALAPFKHLAALSTMTPSRSRRLGPLKAGLAKPDPLKPQPEPLPPLPTAAGPKHAKGRRK